MRPLRSFLLLLIFLACFTGLHYIIPAGHFFPSIYEFIPADIVRSVIRNGNTSSVNEISQVTVSVRTVSDGTDSAKTFSGDTASHTASARLPVDTIIPDPIQIFLDSLRLSKGQVRVMYYGDSQIEGDRISSYLRHTLRNGHGGTGPGLFLPLIPVMYTQSIWLRSSSNWKRYNYLSYKTGEISHRSLGPFMTICRYLPEGERTNLPEKAFVRIKPSNVSDSASATYDELRVFYGNTEDIVNISVKAGDNEIFKDTLKQGKGFYEIKCPLNRASEVEIEFSGTVSPDIYGISIESRTGLIVDNIPQRGSAGLEFTMVDKENLADAYRKLLPDLFILHYGLNIVKNVRNDYSYYQKGLSRQLSLLQEISPLTPILVISLTDMAVNEGDSIKSYHNIPSIIDAQKKATLNAGVAFWDSYDAMGGESSIIKWAKKNPPLAQKDYVHLTYPGADSLSRILTSALFIAAEKDSTSPRSTGPSPDTNILALTKPVIITPHETGGKSAAGVFIESLLRYDPKEPLIFPTAVFWLFFLLVLAGYSLIYKKLIVRNGYLFLVSLFFYYKSGGLFLFLLIFVTLIDFTCGLLIHRSATKSVRRFFILVSILSNLGILAYFKYTGFLVNTVNDIFGTDFRVYDFLASLSNSGFGTSFDITNIILPAGISFFTFQSLSYTIDIYRKKLEPVKNIVDFGFYVSFFPQLVAGPIVRASEFIPQLYKDFHLGKREFSHALFLISKGLIKKIIISDFIATNFIDRVFDAPSVYSGFENLMAIYGYGLQIYCDFSGYTDIAIGVALILGFRLPVNFNSPYKASDIADFWKRWHISLSRWLKDYLYIPLGGNRKGKVRTNINLIITMLIGGLWHGPALRFIIWGGMHGIGLVIARAWKSVFSEKYQTGKAGRALSVFITFQFVSFCWIFFRAPDLESVKIMLKQIAGNFSPGSYLTVIPAYSSVFLLIAVGYIIHFLPEKVKESYRGLFIRIPLTAQLTVIMFVAILLYQMRAIEVVPFIYFRF